MKENEIVLDINDEAYNARIIKEFAGAKELIKQATARANGYKKALSDLVDAHGLRDEKGHLWLEVGGHKIKRELRVSESFNTGKAADWAKAEGVWDDVKEVKEVLSEDKLMALAWDNDEVRSAIEDFYEKREVWAFKA